MRQIEQTNTAVLKSQIELDLKIADFKIKSLLKRKGTCSNGIQDSSGNNLLLNIGTTDVDVEQIIQHTQTDGVSTALAADHLSHVKVSPANTFDLGGDKLRIDSMTMRRLSATSSIIKLTVSYQWRLFNLGRDAVTNEANNTRISNRYHYFNISGTGADVTCESLSSEGLACKVKESICESIGVPEAIFTDNLNGNCECITCSWGTMYGIDSEMRPVCIDPADFNRREQLKVQSAVGIINRVAPTITRDTFTDNDYLFTFDKCPDGEVFIGYQGDGTPACGPTADLSDAPSPPICLNDTDGTKMYLMTYYQNNQLKNRCVREDYIPGQGCAASSTLPAFPQTAVDNGGIPCPGDIQVQHSYFYLQVDDNNCIERTITATDGSSITSDFILRSIRCFPASGSGRYLDCFPPDYPNPGDPGEETNVFTPCI